MLVEVQHYSFWGPVNTKVQIDNKGFGVLNNEAKRVFSTGQCHAFAVALAELTGWPIKGLGGFMDTKDSPAHCVVYCPPLKKYIDIKGFRDKDEYPYKILNRNISNKLANSLKGYLPAHMDSARAMARTMMRDVVLPALARESGCDLKSIG